jgi:hypothetical protein
MPPSDKDMTLLHDIDLEDENNKVTNPGCLHPEAAETTFLALLVPFSLWNRPLKWESL